MAANPEVLEPFETRFPVAPVADLDPITVNGQAIPVGKPDHHQPAVSNAKHDAQGQRGLYVGPPSTWARASSSIKKILFCRSTTPAHSLTQTEPVHKPQNRPSPMFLDSEQHTWLTIYVYSIRCSHLATVNPLRQQLPRRTVTIADLGNNTNGPSDFTDQKTKHLPDSGHSYLVARQTHLQIWRPVQSLHLSTVLPAAQQWRL